MSRRPTQSQIGFKVWQGDGGHRMQSAHAHPELELNFFICGGFEYMHAGHFFRFEKGDLLLFWGGLPHQKLHSDAETHLVWVTVPLPWILEWGLRDNFVKALMAGEMPVIRYDGDGYESLVEKLCGWCDLYDSDDSESRLIITLELEALIRRASLAYAESHPSGLTTSTGVMKKLERAMQFMHDHFRESIRIAEIAEAADLHEKYFMNVFKEQLNISVWDYLLQLRIAHAQWLLLSTDMKVTDIALESGFKSIASFYSAFQKFQTGMNPREYRKQRGASR